VDATETGLLNPSKSIDSKGHPAETRLSSFCDRVVEAGWLVLAVVVPLFFNIFSSRVFEPDKLTLLRSIVLIMAVAWLFRYFTIQRQPTISPLRLARSSLLAFPVLILAGSYVLSTILSVNPAVSFWGSYVRLQGLLTNLAYLTLFFLIAERMRTRAQIDRLISVIIVASIPISIYGIIQHMQLDPMPWGGDVTFRVTSTMGNAIFLAAYLIMVAPLTLARLAQTVRNVLRPAAGKAQTVDKVLLAGFAIALILQLLTILFTKSRGPWIGLASGLFFMLLVWLVRLRKRKLAAYAGGVFAALFVFVLLLNIPKSPLEPLEGLSPYIERLGTILDMDSGTNRVRTLIWFGDGMGKGAAGLIMEAPGRTLIGHGPETMYVAYGPFYPPELAHLEFRNAAPDRSHNDLLDYLVITGFLGLFAYLLVVVRGFSVGLQMLWQEQDFARQAVLVGILGALASHVVESLTGIAIASTLSYTWILLACLAAIAMMPLRETKTAPALAESEAAAGARAPRRRRPDRKESLAKQQRAAMPAQPQLLPWFKRSGFQIVLSYAVLTGAGVIFLLSAATNRDPNPTPFVQALRDPDPAAMVLGGYIWLLVGLLSVTFWVRKPQIPSRRASSQTIMIAVVVGLVAVLLPVKLFLGSVIGDMYFKKGLNITTQRPDIAVGSYLEALNWSPNEDFYFLYLGQAYLDLARNSQGDRPAQRIESVSDLSRFRDRSVAHLGRDNLVKASLVALERAQQLNPMNTDHSANLGRLYRLWAEMSSDASVKQEKFARSIDYYKQATSLSPNAAHLRSEWGLVNSFKGDIQEAARQYQEAIRLDQQFAPSYAYLADLYRSSGDDDKAIELYQKALSVGAQFGTLASPMDTAVRTGLSQQYYKKGLLQESLQEAQKVAQVTPKDFTAHRNLAFIYNALNDRPKALDEARLAVSLAPNEEKASLQALVAELQAAVP